MPHYTLTIISSKTSDAQLTHVLEEKYNILLVDKKKHFRNTIRTEDGYLVVLHKGKRNIEISTEVLLEID